MHGSFSRSNRFLIGAVLLSVASVFCSQGVVAQGPVFLLQAEDDSVDAGTGGSFSILMANAQPLGAFSLGLQHEDWLEVSEIYREKRSKLCWAGSVLPFGLQKLPITAQLPE